MRELGRLSPEEFKTSPKFPYCLVLDELRSVLNVGSLFRSADAFRAEALYLVGLTPQPSREMRKTALGATEAVYWEHHPAIIPLLQKLKAEGYQLWALEQTDQATRLEAWQPQAGKKQAFILGNEVMGVSDEALALCDGALEIPQFGTKHSLNVSVSGGLLMWDFVRRLL